MSDINFKPGFCMLHERGYLWKVTEVIGKKVKMESRNPGDKQFLKETLSVSQLNVLIRYGHYTAYPELQEGQQYFINVKGKEVSYLYQGQDLGRNYTFVNAEGLFKVAENRLLSVYIKPA